MANKTMGEMISSLRKEKGMTQKEVADLLFITDKAVSKWERNITCPDSSIMPKLCEILDVSPEELLNCKISGKTKNTYGMYLLRVILKSIAFACGLVAAAFGAFGMLGVNMGFALVGIGVACIGVALLLDE